MVVICCASVYGLYEYNCKKKKNWPSRQYLKGLNGWMTKTPFSLCLIHAFSTATSLPYTYRDCLFNWGSSRFLHASQLKHPWAPGACFSISGPWLSKLIMKPLLTSLLPSGNFISGLLLCWSCLSSLLLAHTNSNSSSTLVYPSRVAKRIASTRLSILSLYHCQSQLSHQLFSILASCAPEWGTPEMQSGLPTQWGVLNIMAICHLHQTDGCDRTKRLAGPEDFATQIMITMNKRS